MNFDEAAQAAEDAKQTQRAADQMLRNIAYLLRGRLEAAGISHCTLRELKRELGNYNMHTRAWKR